MAYTKVVFLPSIAKVSQWESNLYTDHGYSTSLLVNPGLINQIRYSGAKMNLWRLQPCWRPDCEKWGNTNVLGSRTIVERLRFQDNCWTSRVPGQLFYLISRTQYGWVVQGMKRKQTNTGSHTQTIDYDHTRSHMWAELRTQALDQVWGKASRVGEGLGTRLCLLDNLSWWVQG